MESPNGYQLSRAWFDFCFENPELISPNHTAIYFFAIEHCNRLGWKEKFGFPTQMTMEALGIKKHQTYIKYFNELVEWGFLKLIQKSRNQYSANIISLKSAKPKTGKAMDKAFIGHGAKQTEKQVQSNGQSNRPIDKQETINQEPFEPIKQKTKEEPLRAIGVLPFESEEFVNAWLEWEKFRKELGKKLTPSTAKKQMQFLGGWSELQAIGIINQSITNGWTGLFQLKAQINGTTKTTKQEQSAGTYDYIKQHYRDKLNGQ